MLQHCDVAMNLVVTLTINNFRLTFTVLNLVVEPGDNQLEYQKILRGRAVKRGGAVFSDHYPPFFLSRF